MQNFKVRVLVASLTSVILSTNIFNKPAAAHPSLGTGKMAKSEVELVSTTKIMVTNEAGKKLSIQPNITLTNYPASKPVISVFPDKTKQTLLGIGTSFTESSAFVLAHLDKEKRTKLMSDIYGDGGANFSLARTHIGATDFSVDGKYSYVSEQDVALSSFSIDVDKAGFSKEQHAQLVDEHYDLMPMIKEALAVKEQQADKTLNIIASAWTAPPWMKTINDWYIPPEPSNNYQGTGGELKPQFQATYADYLIKYLDAYKNEGINIWGLTPVNEPHGNSGQWESMHFSPTSQKEFVKQHLGPKLRASGNSDINLLIYDQNREKMEAWTDTILGDPETAQYIYGTAVHWYDSTVDVREDIFERVHEKFPNFGIIHTEGTIDDLGKDAPEGVLDPEGFKEKNWFQNDEFWWNTNATDWAYTATWAPNPENHPKYTPVHRYARDIIVGLNHWLEGWVDWNIVLDRHGGPNHVGNFCGAPIMIDTNTQDIYVTPIFHVLSQFSQTIRPGDKAVKLTLNKNSFDNDALHASASINSDNLLSIQLLNTTKHESAFTIQIAEQFLPIELTANSVTTIQIQL